MKIKYLFICWLLFLLSGKGLLASGESGMGGGHYSEDTISDELDAPNP